VKIVAKHACECIVQVERSLVQILVVVAITQVRYLWAEEEKGFIRTVIGYELVDPK